MSADPIAFALGHLERAAAAELFGESERHVDAIEDTARAVLDVFAETPEQTPALIAALARLAPAVRPSDLSAALCIAQHAYAEHGGTYSPLLHPGCEGWIADAAAAHDAEPSIVAALLAVEVHLDGAPTRPGGLPVTAELRDLVGRARWAELTAARDVTARCVEATEQTARDVDELLALVEPHMATGGTLVGAVDALTGPDRVRAEELLAALPSVVTLPREVTR